jgi:tRNA modification GTPase
VTEPTDTIAAVATAPGRGGIGVVRVSGPAAGAIAEAVLGDCPPPRLAVHRTFRDADGQLIDDGLALYFPSPHSFTGEDVLELQGHGGPMVLDLVLARCVALGARLARPGEFSERAFLNDKLDLAQAEAIADLIDSASHAAARAAVRSLQGEFSARVHALVNGLIQLRAYVEAAIDFPDEEVDFLSDRALHDRLHQLLADLASLRAAAQQGCLLRDGLTLVIAGRPNAGKSSLLNALAGADRAIVTEVPGTTRDVLREHLQIDGLPIHVIDTAGLRETADPVERIGVERAWAEIDRADQVLLVVDDSADITDEDRTLAERLLQGQELTVARNKIDLTGRTAGPVDAKVGTEIAVSARTGAGLDALRAHLKELAGYREAGAGDFSARRRHLEALERAGRHLDTAAEHARNRAGELLAEELRLCQQDLGEITGEFTSDDLLGTIFASFCIGK